MPRPDSTSAFLPAYMERKRLTLATAVGLLLAAALVLSVVALSMAFWITEQDDLLGRNVIVFHSCAIGTTAVAVLAWPFVVDARRVTARRTHIMGFASTLGAGFAFLTVVMRVGASTDRSSSAHTASAYCTAASGVLLAVAAVLTRRSIRFIAVHSARETLV